MTRAPLNVFQRLIRRWESAHPYNAAQAMQIAGEASLSRAMDAWHQTLESCGLGRVRFSGNHLLHESLNGDRHLYPVEVFASGSSLRTHLERELDRPFAPNEGCPFRPFVQPGAGSFWFGVSYRHCVADSVSIRLLLRAWLARYMGELSGLDGPSAIPEHRGYYELFSPRHSRLDESAIDTMRGFFRFRRARKPAPSEEADGSSRVILQTAPEGLLARVKAFSRARERRVGDVMLAALAFAAREHVPFQHRNNRRDIAVASVVDLRPLSAGSLDDRFGLFLGFTSAICPPRDFGSWNDLLDAVARQTRLQRQRGVAGNSLAWMSLASLAGPWLEPGNVYHFFRKHMPFAAGLSSVSLDRSWIRDRHPWPVLDYIRVSPTGPMTPVVMGTTSLGNRLSLSLTFRAALLAPAAAQGLLDAFVDRLCRVDKAD